MEIGHLTLAGPDEWPLIRQRCRDFFRHYGGKRLMQEGIHRLGVLSYEQFMQPGTSIIAATVRSDVGRLPIGICFAENYGHTACIFTVHPIYRRRGVGSSLIRSQLERLGRLRCYAAADHTASLKTCFRAGLHAIALETGPAGKRALVMDGALEAPGSAASVPDSNQEGELLCRSLS